MAVESVHGTLRVVWLQPEVGDFRARQIAVFTGMALILAVSCLTISWIGLRDRASLLRLGALWCVLTLLFEIGIGRLTGASWQRLLSDYDIAHGGLMPLGLLFLLLAPLFAAKIRAQVRS